MTADATSLTSGMRPRIPRGSWWNAAIAASVPWPSASGAKRKTMIPEIRPPRATTSGSAHGSGEARDRGAALAGGRRRRVAAEEAEEELRRQLEGGVERDRPEAADDADQRAEDDPLAEVARAPDAAPDRTQAGVELWGERPSRELLEPGGDRAEPVA